MPSASSSRATSAASSSLSPPRRKSDEFSLTAIVNPSPVARRDAPHGLEQCSGTTGDVAAPPVGAVVRGGGEELGQQVAVGGVDLHAVEAGVAAPQRRFGEPVDDSVDLVVVQRPRPRERPEHRHRRTGRRGDGAPRHEAVGLAPRVVELGQRGHVTGAGGVGGQPVGVDQRVGDHVARPFQVAAVHHQVAREQQSRPAVRPLAVEALQAGRRLVVRVRQVLGHRRLGDAVGQAEPAAQGQRVGQPDGAVGDGTGAPGVGAPRVTERR